MTAEVSEELREARADLVAASIDPPWLVELEALADALKRENRALGLNPSPTLTLIRGGRDDAS